MKSNDIAVAFIEFRGSAGGKTRPVLILFEKENSYYVFPFTTKYKTKSDKIRRQYYKVKYWMESGLKKESWIDTGSILCLTKNDYNLIKIGKLSEYDIEGLIKFYKYWQVGK